MRWFSRWYGAGPLHLLTLLGCLALAGYAAQRLLPHDAAGVLEWLAGAVIGHDLLLMPLYTLADRSVTAVFRHRRLPHPPAVSWINHLRVPAGLSGMLLLIWFPLIFRLPARFTILTSLPLGPYLWHWLAVTGALFLASAVALAVRLAGHRRGEPVPVTGGETLPRRDAYPGRDTAADGIPRYQRGEGQEPVYDQFDHDYRTRRQDERCPGAWSAPGRNGGRRPPGRHRPGPGWGGPA